MASPSSSLFDFSPGPGSPYTPNHVSLTLCPTSTGSVLAFSFFCCFSLQYVQRHDSSEFMGLQRIGKIEKNRMCIVIMMPPVPLCFLLAPSQLDNRSQRQQQYHLFVQRFSWLHTLIPVVLTTSHILLWTYGEIQVRQHRHFITTRRSLTLAIEHMPEGS